MVWSRRNSLTEGWRRGSVGEKGWKWQRQMTTYNFAPSRLERKLQNSSASQRAIALVPQFLQQHTEFYGAVLSLANKGKTESCQHLSGTRWVYHSSPVSAAIEMDTLFIFSSTSRCHNGWVPGPGKTCDIIFLVSDFLWPHGLYSPPGSSVHGILQARILEWVAIPFSGGSS